MFVIQIATIYLLVLAVGAEKKIGLLDIEEDNLRSENSQQNKDSEVLTSYREPERPRPHVDGTDNNFRVAPVNPQQQRYVQQYAVTESPENPDFKEKYLPPKPSLFGYFPNFPLQLYVFPHYGMPPFQSLADNPAGYQIVNPKVVLSQYPSMQEEQQSQTHSHVQAFEPPVQVISYQTAPVPQRGVIPYRSPVIHYNPTTLQPISHDTHSNIPHYDNTQYEVYKPVNPHTGNSYNTKESELPRHYNSKSPIVDDYLKVNIYPELPRPDPKLFKAPHPSLLPKALPQFRRPIVGRLNSYGPPAPVSKSPTSLLESYIPSDIQYRYLRKGIFKNPIEVYDALSSGQIPYPIPQHYERGFLPNQMYHTAGGGVTYGFLKRGAKSDKSHKKIFD